MTNYSINEASYVGNLDALDIDIKATDVGGLDVLDINIEALIRTLDDLTGSKLYHFDNHRNNI